MLAVLPSAKSPTVSELAGGGFAVESVVDKRTINLIISLDDVANDGGAGAADNIGSDVENVNGGSGLYWYSPRVCSTSGNETPAASSRAIRDIVVAVRNEQAAK